ncbi:MAG: SDR family oxidoreductase [Streptosporangiales bacterium]|nr:SDR family oxidoreductase [Streptosporangiales bacterium]
MKTAIVTGATSGIGRAAALALRDAGYWVLANGRDPARGKEVAEALGSGGTFLGEDLTRAGAPEQVVRTAVDETGRLDVLVNNAGIYVLATTEETGPEELDRLMGINLRAAMLLTRAAIPAMRASGGGVVINVSSEAGLVALPGQVAYNVSKAALLMFSKSLAVDHAGDGIRAVSVCPGTTRTPLVENAIATAEDPAALEHRLTSIRPAKRLGRPEEIAAAIVFAAGDDAGYMTGSELVIDGGYTAM